MKQLLLGSGTDTRKRMWTGDNTEWDDVVKLDIDPNVNPDYVFDLNNIHHNTASLPFAANTFNEIHAYDVLEHIGTQGNYVGFFNEFAEYYRVIKNQGLFYILVPAATSIWAWGDPGHTRVFTPGTWTFLNQQTYLDDVGKSARTDYRYLWSGDFRIVHYHERGDTAEVVLKAYKENNANKS